MSSDFGLAHLFILVMSIYDDVPPACTSTSDVVA